MALRLVFIKDDAYLIKKRFIQPFKAFCYVFMYGRDEYERFYVMDLNIL